MPSAVLWALSRWTSAVRCTSWRRASILVGILGATVRRTTTCFPSDPSEWCVNAHTQCSNTFRPVIWMTLKCIDHFLDPAGPWEAQDLPVWGWYVQGPQDGDHGWWRSQPVLLRIHRQSWQHHGQLRNVSAKYPWPLRFHLDKPLRTSQKLHSIDERGCQKHIKLLTRKITW